MTETTETQLNTVQFNQLGLPRMLSLPEGVLVDFLPEHTAPVRHGMERGALETPIDALLLAEGITLNPRAPSKLDAFCSGVRVNIDRIEKTKDYVSSQADFFTDYNNAQFMIGTAFYELGELVKYVGKVNQWSSDDITRSSKVISAELIDVNETNKVEAWTWWLDLLACYGQRKLNYAQSFMHE